MDFKLHCNSLKCRRQLDGRAVVTTCSHIFCVQCSDVLGLSNAASDQRVCPACQIRLANADDAVATQLNPSEDYKTSVLSGLSPSVIMECAGRGLAFYSYQTTQEIVYQEFMAKSLTDKYTVLSSQMDQVVHDANNEIIALRNKISAAQQEYAHLQKGNDELKQSLKTKTIALHKSQQLYDDVKKRLLQSDLQNAAATTVEDTLASVTADVYDDTSLFLPREMRQSQRTAPEQRGYRTALQSCRIESSGGEEMLRLNQQDLRNVHGSVWSGDARMIPSAIEHRTRLPVATPQARRTRQSNDFSTALPHALGDNSVRRPLGALDPNTTGNGPTAVYGMSAGIKAGRMRGDRMHANSARRSDLSNMTLH